MEKKGYLVMVIEDEEVLLEAISQKLTKYGFRTVTCISATQALNYLKDLQSLPDIIWLDYYLEDMNGAEFIDKVNENPNWKKIPVVVVSNSASPQKVQNMLAKGAKKYLIKADYKLKDIVEILLGYLPNKTEKLREGDG